VVENEKAVYLLRSCDSSTERGRALALTVCGCLLPHLRNSLALCQYWRWYKKSGSSPAAWEGKRDNGYNFCPR